MPHSWDEGMKTHDVSLERIESLNVYDAFDESVHVDVSLERIESILGTPWDTSTALADVSLERIERESGQQYHSLQ